MKRMLSLFIMLLVIPCLLVSAAAAVPPPVWDEAGILTETEENTLYEAVSALKKDYDIDAMIVAAASLNGESAQKKADQLYDFLGGGDDGVLFLLAMEEREWYISTCGDMIYALTDYGIQQIGEGAITYISQGDYCGGFRHFLNSLPEYLDAFADGTPIDGYADYSGDFYHGDAGETVYYEESSPSFFLSLIIGLAVGGITVFIMYRMMDEKNKQHGAAAYMKDGSFHLNKRRDLFLYSNLSKTRRQENNGSSGGGSSVHRSSGGRSHGGGGGKF